MKRFHCACGARLFFENVSCLNCKQQVGFLPDRACFVTAGSFAPLSSGAPREAPVAEDFYLEQRQLQRCQNSELGANCNWLVDVAEGNDLCQACRLNRTIPNLEDPGNVEKWQAIEGAKRRVVYSLNGLGLPPTPATADEPGLAFDFLVATKERPVITGHKNGVITLNLSEADPVTRERVRKDLNEPYRTLLGHFRHEVGHYYFHVLVSDPAVLQRFRELFGDERADYQAALKEHYAAPLREGWHEEYISTYAGAHPHEDWAETWAHYLHMLDALETIHENGLGTPPASSPLAADFDDMLSRWQLVSVALNEVNRSLGLNDAYPFAVSAGVRTKLHFVHEVISAANDERTQFVRSQG